MIHRCNFFSPVLTVEGYWTNSHVKLQLEDLVDCLHVIFSTFDFVIMFDQSSDHCKVRTDGLLVSNMNVTYGGNVNTMRDTIIKEVGESNLSLTVGGKQNMISMKMIEVLFG